MKNEQVLMVGKHGQLLDFIWTWGWGCALQPLLVEVSTWFEWYASEQMCRRGIRELRNAGLLKAKTWVDGKSEILILTKPAIAFVSGKDVKEISSFPKHSTRDSELLSICRMMFVMQYAKNKRNHNYDSIYGRFENSIRTIHLRVGDLVFYWQNSLFFKQFKHHLRQHNYLHCSRVERLQLHLEKGERFPTEKDKFSGVTIESLHRRGISIVGRKKEGEKTQLLFGVFNIHDLTAKRVMDYYVLCNDWVKSLHDNLEARLIVYCLDPIQKKHLEFGLLKISHGHPFWEYTLLQKADTTKGIPVNIRNLDLKAKYLKVGSLC